VKPRQIVWLKSASIVGVALVVVPSATSIDLLHLGVMRWPVAILTLALVAGTTPAALDAVIVAWKIRQRGADRTEATLERHIRRHWKQICDESGLTAVKTIKHGDSGNGESDVERKWRSRITAVRPTPLGLDVHVQPPGKGINAQSIVAAHASIDYWIDLIAPMHVKVEVVASRGAVAIIRVCWRDPLAHVLGLPDDALPPGWQS